MNVRRSSFTADDLRSLNGDRQLAVGFLRPFYDVHYAPHNIGRQYDDIISTCVP
jgi:hypothetical protein